MTDILAQNLPGGSKTVKENPRSWKPGRLEKFRKTMKKNAAAKAAAKTVSKKAAKPKNMMGGTKIIKPVIKKPVKSTSIALSAIPAKAIPPGKTARPVQAAKQGLPKPKAKRDNAAIAVALMQIAIELLSQ